ncbi:MAG: DUF1471 domain-containing protein [Yokenella regensburgei]|jgi:MqsR-controlled colanic acid and biofilm protein A|uniref:MqsR-controlled colanic acid and biofilm protein A n=1 Tax=Yokenella regensburgei TaxID=158877 RepID=A0AB38FRV0_9ENTR|nr:YdgH/BhsA/McbA-like domain containing protein [Yokenella regensburgei]EHM47881.1 MqsR-controlled colanic acid and biofilm protein A [Yokenella regensburgei ATCC 43003]KAF1371072.1 MqsR-controlled colanic acid and biofilm protein A [Yokenella regensburgei]KFD19375.1 putative exported protein [Yokenella regensburgei ATCC 49455]MDQ4431473.1 DUF1471 domain-containing protein [Yokenella regensburgei]MDR2217874.1 DUF1471 domain-containing protein [Yokenella regensburgei]
MKSRVVLIAAGALALLSFAAHAKPQELDPANTGQLRPAGTVSATGASNLDDLQAKLAAKAQAEGAKGYVITGASGENKMFGTATIYK